MKRFFCIVLVLLCVLSVTACNKQSGTKNIMSDDSDMVQEVDTVSLPVAKTLTHEESKNNLGARYTFTLKEFNTMLNSASENLGSDAQSFDFDNWQIMSDELEDDNGIMYSSYYYPTDTLTITAAVESESGKVMNLGCGATYEEFVEADADYQYTVMLTAAIIAMVAGGYTEDDLEFLYYIFYDSAKHNEQFFYNNSVYMMNLSKAEGVEGSAVLFMTSPCKDEVLDEWELTDYAQYDGSYKAD